MRLVHREREGEYKDVSIDGALTGYPAKHIEFDYWDFKKLLEHSDEDRRNLLTHIFMRLQPNEL
jgi:hypothetical protein